MKINNSLIDLLSSSTNLFRTNFEYAMNEIGLHSGQVFILISLWENDGQSQINLAQQLNLSAPTVNNMVKSLLANGFVTNNKCEADGRVMRVYLTDKGTEIKPAVENQWKKIEEKTFANFTETENLIFGQLLVKLKENFSAK